MSTSPIPDAHLALTSSEVLKSSRVLEEEVVHDSSNHFHRQAEHVIAGLFVLIGKALVSRVHEKSSVKGCLQMAFGEVVRV